MMKISWMLGLPPITNDGLVSSDLKYMFPDMATAQRASEGVIVFFHYYKKGLIIESKTIKSAMATILINSQTNFPYRIDLIDEDLPGVLEKFSDMVNDIDLSRTFKAISQQVRDSCWEIAFSKI